MTVTLIISLALQTLATAWAAVLLWKMRDWRIGFLVVFLALMLLRRVLQLVGEPVLGLSDPQRESFVESIALLASVLAVAAVGFLDVYLHRREKSDRRLRLLAGALETSSMPMFITNAADEGVGPSLVMVNQAACDLTGYTREELVGRPLASIETPKSAGHVRELTRRVLSGETGVVAEALGKRKDGSAYWVSCTVSPVRDVRQRITHLLWLKNDVSERKAAEQARQRSEALARSALDSLDAHICLVDREGVILATNYSWKKFHNQNDPVGQRTCGSGENYFEVCRVAAESGDADARRSLEGMQAVLEGRMPQFDLEYPCHSPTQRQWYLMRVTPMSHAAGGLVISHIDITALRLIEETLRQQEQKYRLIVETAAEGIWLVDPQWHTTYTNQRLARMLGTTPQEMIGKPITDYMDEEGKRQVQELMQRRESGQAEQHDFRFKRRDGTDLWALVSTNALQDPTGKFSGALAMLSDIGARKSAEDLLRAALQKLSFHVDNSPLGVIEWDCEFRVRQWSSGAERIFGWKSEDVIGKHPREWKIIHQDDAPAVDAVMGRLTAGADQRNTCLNRNYNRAGEVIWCQWYNSVLLDPDGRVNSILSIAHDVTDRHRAEERQRLLMLELDHRVRNNLATVLGIAQQTVDASNSLEEFSQAFVGRIESLARAHALLARASWEGVELRALCESILEPCLLGKKPQVIVEGDRLVLSARQGSVLALSLHELMTNGMKYGALSVPEGKVSIDWQVETREKGVGIRLYWRERGGPKVSKPAKDGFGCQFIRTAVAYELRGTAELEYDDSGFVCCLNFPMDINVRTNGVSTRTPSAGGV